MVLEEDEDDDDEDDDEFELDEGEATMGESQDGDAVEGAGVGESRLMTLGLESTNAVDDIGWGESHSLSESDSSSELTVKSITSILGFFGAGPDVEADLDSFCTDLWAAGLQDITWVSLEAFSGLQDPSSWNWISFMSDVFCNISTNNPSINSR